MNNIQWGSRYVIFFKGEECVVILAVIQMDFLFMECFHGFDEFSKCTYNMNKCLVDSFFDVIWKRIFNSDNNI